MDLSKILEDISTIRAEIIEIKKRLEAIEKSSEVTGVYFDGCPEYVTDYVAKNNKDKKEGE